MKTLFRHSRLFVLPLFFMAACSTTRVLSEGEYRLAENRLVIEGEGKERPEASDLEKYVKQKANSYLVAGWNPFLCIYNWSGRKEGGLLSRFLRSIGSAPVVLDTALVRLSRENIGNHLRFIGYYGAEVGAEVETEGRLARVIYRINPGKRLKINKITYSLPERGTFAADYLKDTASVTVRRGDRLSEEALEAESERAAAHFRELGYYGFSKNHFFFQADTLSDPSGANLEIRVNEYTRNEDPKTAEPIVRYRFGKVSILHPARLDFDAALLRKLNLIVPGQPYSEKTVNDTYGRLSSLNLFSSVNIELNGRKEGRDGEEKAPDGENPVGQEETRRDGQQAYGSGGVAYRDGQEKAPDGEGLVDCEIRLNPSRLQGFKTELEVSSNSSGLLGISPGLSYYHKNLFRGGEWLNLGFMGNFQFRPHDQVHSNEFGVTAGISFPRLALLPFSRFRGQVPRMEIKASYNFQNRPEYTRNLLSTSFSYSGYHRRLYYQANPLQLKIVRLYHLDEAFYRSLSDNPFMRNAYQDHFDFGAGGVLYFSNTSEVVPKGDYHFLRLQADVSGNFLSIFKSLMAKDENGAAKIWDTPFSQYVRGELSAGKVWRFGRHEASALAARLTAGAGYAYGNSKALPFDRHFHAGGANSLRGWQARSVGPGLAGADTTFVIPNQSGDMKLEANVECRFRLFWKFEGALFADAGNVWTYPGKGEMAENVRLGCFDFRRFGESIAADWGLGLRLNLNFILVRFDLGLRVHDPARAPGSRWCGPRDWFRRDGCALHFGVGYPF